MIGLLMASIGIGLAVSLIFTELFALSTGGMVVAGYVALYLNQPDHVVLTVLGAYLTLLIVRGLGTVVVIYGRRQVAAMVLVGYLVGVAVSFIAALWGPVIGQALGLAASAPASDAIVVHSIGFIIPGLIAIWFDRQGVLPTLCVLVAGSAIVRLILIIVFGPGLAASNGLPLLRLASGL